MHKWLMVEIITFYGLIVSAIIYLFCASMWSFKRSNFTSKESSDITDFLSYTEDLYYYFGLNTTQFVVTIVVLIVEFDVQCSSNNGASFKPTICVLLAIHGLQFLFSVLFVYVIKDNLISAVVYILFATITPALMFIYVVISLFTTKGCQILMKNWIITDCIVYIFILLSVGGWISKIVKKRNNYSLVKSTISNVMSFKLEEAK